MLSACKKVAQTHFLESIFIKIGTCLSEALQMSYAIINAVVPKEKPFTVKSYVLKEWLTISIKSGKSATNVY